MVAARKTCVAPTGILRTESRDAMGAPRVTVVVLGDLARSPRTLNHIVALARCGAAVDVVAYIETPLPSNVTATRNVTLHPVSGRLTQGGASRSVAVLGLLRTTLELLHTLVRRVGSPDVILVQNPPGLPTLPVAWITSRLRGSRFVIDWHNLTWSMLALKFGPTHVFVRMAAAIERFVGRRADANLFVTAAMRDDLAQRWNLRGAVFEDHPGRQFRVRPARMRDRVRGYLCQRLGLDWGGAPFGLVVTSSSWTADEDFDLLLDAAARCEGLAAEEGRGEAHRPILILATGKGPMREIYERRFRAHQGRRIVLRTLWVDAICYPRLLSAADVGVCLHRSSSGLDFPMKVVDFQGAGLPVFAYDYGRCMSERMERGRLGGLFTTPEGLAALLHRAFQPTHEGRLCIELEKQDLRRSGKDTWWNVWTREARPHLLPDGL